MTEEVIIQLFTNAPGWVILYIVFREGMKSYSQQQDHDRTIILQLVNTIKELSVKCVEKEGD